MWLSNSLLLAEKLATKINDLYIQKGAGFSGLVGWKCCRKHDTHIIQLPPHNQNRYKHNIQLSNISKDY